MSKNASRCIKTGTRRSSAVFSTLLVVGSALVSAIPPAQGAVGDLDNRSGTPTNADFHVRGDMKTAGPSDNNTVRSLSFGPKASLDVYNRLTVTSGKITVAGWEAEIFGDRLSTGRGDFHLLGYGSLVSGIDIETRGVAYISEGQFMVDGSLAANKGVRVGIGGLLGGYGIIYGNVENGGVVVPANSAGDGELTIYGNFTQKKGAAMIIEAKAWGHDFLWVSGTAKLDGDLVYFSDRSFEYGDEITFLEADKVEGKFRRVTILDKGPRWRLVYGSDEVSFIYAPDTYTWFARNKNQRRLARALDRFIPATSGDREEVSIALDRLRADEYSDAFNQIAPTFYEGLLNVTIEQSNAQGILLQQRLSALRFGVSGFQQSGVNAPVLASNGKTSVGLHKEKTLLEVVPETTRWNTWVQASGLFARNYSLNSIPNYSFDSGEYLVGADYRWNDAFATGLFAGYQHAKARYDGGSSNIIDAARFGTYATYYTPCGFYADAVVGGGVTHYKIRRNINFSDIDRTARANSNGGEFTALLGLGKDWNFGGFTVGPIVSGQYTYAGLAPFSESGADSLNLRIEEQHAHSLRSTLGARAAYTWALCNDVALTPEVRMSWQHEFLQNKRGLHAHLEGGAGPAFDYTTSRVSRDAAIAAAGLNLNVGDRWGANLYYNANFGRQDFVSHMVSGGLNFKF